MAEKLPVVEPVVEHKGLGWLGEFERERGRHLRAGQP